MHPDQDDLHPWLGPEKDFLRDLVERDVPVLGVCLGAELVAQAAGARVTRREAPEIGWHDVELTAEGRGDPVTAVAPPRFPAFEWHSYECELPPEGIALARNGACLQAFRVRAAWGIQFHAEVTREIAEHWLAHPDEDAIRAGLDPAPIAERTEHEIEAFNALGRDLCTRFLARAERRRRQSP